MDDDSRSLPWAAYAAVRLLPAFIVHRRADGSDQACYVDMRATFQPTASCLLPEQNDQT
ncbi:MAG: hypothetical protein J2P16_02225 [Mycobacterium sp.]|nr:hypothetical protein [Mycobacterium sp.]